MPAAGDAAPLFEAPSQGGTSIELSQFRGSKVALYFYPKDDTPGCTKQACNLRDNTEELTRHGVAVVGVSPDDVASHDRFAANHELSFPLVADPDKAIIRAYGVEGIKKMYGRTYMGIHRTTFLIDEQGVIASVIRRPKTALHAAEILRGFGIAA